MRSSHTIAIRPIHTRPHMKWVQLDVIHFLRTHMRYEHSNHDYDRRHRVQSPLFRCSNRYEQKPRETKNIETLWLQLNTLRAACAYLPTRNRSTKTIVSVDKCCIIHHASSGRATRYALLRGPIKWVFVCFHQSGSSGFLIVSRLHVFHSLTSSVCPQHNCQVMRQCTKKIAIAVYVSDERYGNGDRQT